MAMPLVLLAGSLSAAAAAPSSSDVVRTPIPAPSGRFLAVGFCYVSDVDADEVADGHHTVQSGDGDAEVSGHIQVGIGVEGEDVGLKPGQATGDLLSGVPKPEQPDILAADFDTGEPVSAAGSNGAVLCHDGACGGEHEHQRQFRYRVRVPPGVLVTSTLCAWAAAPSMPAPNLDRIFKLGAWAMTSASQLSMPTMTASTFRRKRLNVRLGEGHGPDILDQLVPAGLERSARIGA